MAKSLPKGSDTNESESDDVFDFVIIEFIKRGRKTKKKCVHVVPSIWLKYDDKKKHYTCPFPPEPCDNIDNIMRNQTPPDQSWNIYNVKVKGHDDNYKQAKKKAKKLEIKDNAFSSDTDLNSTEKTTQLEEAVKIKILKESLAAMKKNMDLANNHEDLSDLMKNLSSEPTSSDGASDTSKIESSSNRESSANKKLNKRSKNTKKSIHQKSVNNISGNFIGNMTSTSTSCFQNKMKCTQELFDAETPIDAYVDHDGAIVVSDINKHGINHKNTENKVNNVTRISQNQFIELMEKLTCLEVDIKTQTASIHRIEHILEQQLGYTLRKEYTNQFGTDFPIEEIHKLREIDKQLKDDNDFKIKLTTAINSVIDPDETLSINATEVLKKIFKRKLAMLFTAVRQMENKFLFSSEAPILCNCIKEILSTRLQKIPKKVMSALGTAFTNSKDWDGHLVDRIKKGKELSAVPDRVDA